MNVSMPDNAPLEPPAAQPGPSPAPASRAPERPHARARGPAWTKAREPSNDSRTGSGSGEKLKWRLRRYPRLCNLIGNSDCLKLSGFLALQLGPDLFEPPHSLLRVKPLSATEANLGASLQDCGIDPPLVRPSQLPSPQDRRRRPGTFQKA